MVLQDPAHLGKLDKQTINRPANQPKDQHKGSIYSLKNKEMS